MELLFTNIAIVLVSCIALGQGAGWLVDSAGRLARKYGISDLVIGLTVVAFGSSAPEFAATVFSAIAEKDDVSVANIIGSNIFNIGFILGSCAIITTLYITPLLVKRDGAILAAITGLLCFMMRDLQLSRGEGVILFLLLIVYLAYLIIKKDTSMVEEDEICHEPAKPTDWLLLLFSLGVIAAGGQALVFGAVGIAQYYGLNEWIIGMTIVAAGTSMPEFVISLVAVLKKNHGISAGNLIGSNIFNTLGVLGLAVWINPLTVDSAGLTSTILLIPLTLIVILFMWTGRKITRLEGIIILILSLAIFGYNFHLGKQQADKKAETETSLIINE